MKSVKKCFLLYPAACKQLFSMSTKNLIQHIIFEVLDFLGQIRGNTVSLEVFSLKLVGRSMYFWSILDLENKIANCWVNIINLCFNTYHVLNAFFNRDLNTLVATYSTCKKHLFDKSHTSCFWTTRCGVCGPIEMRARLLPPGDSCVTHIIQLAPKIFY